MVFHRAKHKLNNISISLNSVPIEQVNHTKYLGVVIDNKLDWSNHISYINEKKSQKNGHNIQSQEILFKLSSHKFIQYFYTSLHDLLCGEMG